MGRMPLLMLLNSQMEGMDFQGDSQESNMACRNGHDDLSVSVV